MSQTPRHIKTDRSLNRPTERRAEKAPASRPVQPAQPDFFAEEKPAPAEPPRRAGGSGGAKPPRRSAPAGGHEPPRRRKKKKKTPLWLPLAVTLAVLAVISGVVVYAVGMVGRVEAPAPAGKRRPTPPPGRRPCGRAGQCPPSR